MVNVAALREIAAVLNRYEPGRYKIDDDGQIWNKGSGMQLARRGGNEARTLRDMMKSRKRELQLDIEKIDWLLEVTELSEAADTS